MSNNQPRVTVIVEGGVVQAVYSDTPASVVVIDYDEADDVYYKPEATTSADDSTLPGDIAEVAVAARDPNDRRTMAEIIAAYSDDARGSPNKVVIIVAEVSPLSGLTRGSPLNDLACRLQRQDLIDVTVYACVDDLLSDLHEGVNSQRDGTPVPLAPDDASAITSNERDRPHVSMVFHPAPPGTSAPNEAPGGQTHGEPTEVPGDG